MFTVTSALVALALVQVFEFIGLLTLFFALVAQHRRHDRLSGRVGSLARNVTKIGRMRTKPPTGELDATRLMQRPPPPFPVPLPHTNPMTPASGKHSAR